jgi:hypothetical protein
MDISVLRGAKPGNTKQAIEVTRSGGGDEKLASDTLLMRFQSLSDAVGHSCIPLLWRSVSHLLERLSVGSDTWAADRSQVPDYLDHTAVIDRCCAIFNLSVTSCGRLVSGAVENYSSGRKHCALMQT